MRNNKLKIRRKVVLIMFFLIILTVIAITMVRGTMLEISDEQKSIQEVADAYYNRGTNAQYCSFRKSFFYSPEDATSQHTIYSVCSCFTYSVYNQTFGIQIPEITPKLMAYGQKYYDTNNIITNDVIEYWEKSNDEKGNVVYTDNKGNTKNIDLSTTKGIEEYVDMLLTECDLQVGDILCYYSEEDGRSCFISI